MSRRKVLRSPGPVVHQANSEHVGALYVCDPCTYVTIERCLLKYKG